MARWLVPFQGRNYSGVYNQNFVWQYENIYIMDNHRGALWCWVQHIRSNESVSLIHIDRHTDTLYSQIESWLEKCPDLWNIGLDDYLTFIHQRNLNLNLLLFRWDNYMSIFLEKHGCLIETCIFATHKEGDEPKHRRLQQYDPWDLPGNFEYWLIESKTPWICNIDLDYFVYPSGGSEYARFFSEDYFLQLFTGVKQQLRTGNIKVLTICLSPECCGGWEMSESLCSRACEILELDFKLPSALA
jgi:hypothetical protein